LWYTNSRTCFWWFTTFTEATEEYNGTSWTSGNNLNTARFYLAGAGTQTAALAFGGGILQVLQQQQKNMMELLGQQVQEV
jgi:hypothetical protein